MKGSTRNHKGGNGADLPDNTGKKYNRTAPYDPRVDIFKQFYMRPDSYTFMNARSSALRAGYTENYANNITVQRPKWYMEMLESAEYKRAAMLQAAENNLYETVSQQYEDINHLKIQHDATKFIAERLGKEHYSSRQEVTGADGRRLFDNTKRERATVPLHKLFKPTPQQDTK